MRHRLPCPDCGKKLRNERALASHRKDAHGVLPREEAFNRPADDGNGWFYAGLCIVGAGIAISGMLLWWT